MEKLFERSEAFKKMIKIQLQNNYHGKSVKTRRPQNVTSKEKKNLLRQLKKRGANIPTAQRECGLTHITRQKAFT